MNKQLTTFALSIILVAILSSCSCAIFVEDYSIHHPEVTRIAEAAKGAFEQADFKERSSEPEGISYFKKRDLKLFYSESQHTIRLHSSYCPILIFKMNPARWMARCELYVKELKSDLTDAGFQVNELSPLDFQRQPTGSTESNQSL